MDMNLRALSRFGNRDARQRTAHREGLTGVTVASKQVRFLSKPANLIDRWRNGIRTLKADIGSTNPNNSCMATAVVWTPVPWPIRTAAIVGQTRGLLDGNMQGSNPARSTTFLTHNRSAGRRRLPAPNCKRAAMPQRDGQSTRSNAVPVRQEYFMGMCQQWQASGAAVGPKLRPHSHAHHSPSRRKASTDRETRMARLGPGNAGLCGDSGQDRLLAS